MKNIKAVIGSIVLATAATAAFATDPANPTGPWAVEHSAFFQQPQTRIAGYQPQPWAVERSALFQQSPVDVAGSQPQPWAVERSAYFPRPSAVADSGDGNSNRGRL
ncbi:MAG: hypothetical protein WDZ63_17095 [Burkholderiales bacterium]